MNSPFSPKKQALLLCGLVFFMLALAYASVPLYRIFCQKTGFAGTPKINATVPSKPMMTRKIKVKFAANVNHDLNWTFIPLQHEVEINIGEVGLAFYRAKNNSDVPIIGMSTYNVTPEKAGGYFSKISCFCFEQQLLLPGQEIDMPLQFFIDPEMLENSNVDDVKTITLSYTFFKYKS